MSTCSCGELLSESVPLTAGIERLKSCPHCSTTAGHHVFYPEDTFGKRDMGNSRVIIQSWCSECRADQPVTQAAAYECA